MFVFTKNERAFVTDLNNLALMHIKAVKSGCAVSENTPTPNMVVKLALGNIIFDNAVTGVAGQTVTLNASDPSNDRIDLITLDNGGNIGKVTGTPSTDPNTPTYDPTTVVIVARVLVQDGITQIFNADITDLRVLSGYFLLGTEHVLPETTDIYDLGSGTYKWRDGYFLRNMSIGGYLQLNPSSTPGVNNALYVDTVDKDLKFKNDSGVVKKVINNPLQFAENTVINGLTLSGTAAQTVNISSGYFVDGDGEIQYNAGNASLALSAADGANPRFDLISIQDGGTLVVTDGTPAVEASLTIPATPANETVLGYVRRAASDNTTADDDMVQCHVIWSPNMDKICEFEISSTNNALFQRIPLKNGPFTYKKIRIHVTLRKSGVDLVTYFRANNLAGGADYKNQQTYVLVAGGAFYGTTTPSWMIYPAGRTQGELWVDLAIDKYIGDTGKETIFGNAVDSSSTVYNADRTYIKDNGCLIANHPTSIDFLSMSVNYSTGYSKVVVYGIK